MKRVIFKSVCSTQYMMFAVHKVWTNLNSNLQTITTFFTQEDASEGPILMIYIMDKGLVPFHWSLYMRQGFSIRTPVPFMLEKWNMCDVYRLISLSFEPTTVFYITPADIAMLELVLKAHKQKCVRLVSVADRTLGILNLTCITTFQICSNHCQHR